MSWCQNVLTLLFFHLAVSSSRTLNMDRGCPTCKGHQGTRTPTHRRRPAEPDTTVLALGEPCGVYTLSCAPGLRCAPPEDHPSPVHALLDGRGSCSNSNRTHATKRNQTADTTASGNLPADTAPCRRLQITILKGFDTQLIRSDRNVYIPNCDQQGLFKRKQCWSSRGTLRGRCWCVDQTGLPMLAPTRQEGPLVCDSA